MCNAGAHLSGADDADTLDHCLALPPAVRRR
jgi:hypothetical protein